MVQGVLEKEGRVQLEASSPKMRKKKRRGKKGEEVGEGADVSNGLGGVVYHVCPLGNRRVEFLESLVRWSTTSVSPSVPFPPSLTFPCFTR